MGAFDLSAESFESVNQLGDFAGELKQSVVEAECCVAVGELGMELDSHHPSIMA